MSDEQPQAWPLAGATQATEPSGTLTRTAGVARPTILVVEDDPQHWEIYGKILWYNGYDVLHADTGGEAYRLACEHEPDLVLLDLMMPDMHGIELCRRLKRKRSTAEIPILVLSGTSYAEAGAAALDAGCAAYMEKPAVPIEVLHRVEDLVGRPPLPGEGTAPTVFPQTA
jgi:two-component system phosphate regulon response regulator PhoB